MSHALLNQEDRPAQGRRRLSRKRVTATVALPVVQRERWSVARLIAGFILTLFELMFRGAELVRHRGPGLRPEERYEFEPIEARDALRRNTYL